MRFPTSLIFQIIPQSDISFIDRQLVEHTDETTVRQKIVRPQSAWNETSSDVDRISASDVDDVALRRRLADDPLVIVGSIEYRFDASDVETTDVANPFSRYLVPHVLLLKKIFKNNCHVFLCWLFMRNYTFFGHKLMTDVHSNPQNLISKNILCYLHGKSFITKLFLKKAKNINKF